MIHTTRRALLGGLTLVPAAAALPAFAADDRAARSDTALETVFAEHGPPAMTAGVVDSTGLVWSARRGVRRAGGSEAVGPDDRWHLGSNGKAMTAVLYARLVDQGRARWGATLPDLFPGLTIDPALQAVTIDELLCHRSGLIDRDIMTREVLIAGHQDRRPTREQRVDLAASVLGKTPTGARGTFSYANANYVMAGGAIERLLDEPWEDALQAEVFAPLGITTAGHGAPLGENPWGHRQMGETLGAVDPTRGADNPAAFGPAGRVHMTSADYARFLRVYLTRGEGFLQPATFDQLMTPLPGEGRPYAYGWGLSTDQAWARGPALGHEGSNTMWHAIARVAPARQVAVFAVSNERPKGGPADQAMAQRLIDIWAPA